MGHFYTQMIGTGINQEAAVSAAIGEFLYEEGARHDVREVLNPTFLKRVPPKMEVTTRRGRYVYSEQHDNPAAPQEQWLEVWTFELHTHA